MLRDTESKLLREMDVETLEDAIADCFIEEQEQCPDYVGEYDYCFQLGRECSLEECPETCRENIVEEISDSLELSRGGLR